MKSEKLFDKKVADKLSVIHITDPANAWEQFMAHHHKSNLEKAFLFDQAVKGHTSPLVNTDINGHWEIFSNKFQYESGLDAQLFDKQIRTKVAGDYLAVGNSIGGAIPDFLLRQRRNTQLRIFKSMEVAAIFMVFFLAWYTLVPHFANSNFGKIAIQDNSQNSSSSSSSLANTDKFESVQKITSEKDKDKSNRVKSNTLLVESNVGIDQSDNKLSAQYNSKINRAPSSTHLIASSEIQIENQTLEISSSESRLQSGSQKGVNSWAARETQVYSRNNESGAPIPNSTSVSSLPAYRFDLSMLESKDSDPVSLFTNDNFGTLLNTFNNTVNKKIGIISKIMLGFHVGPVIDRVTTPISNFAGKKNYSRGIYNNLAGINVEIENRWVNVETGINYSYKNYGVNQQDGSKGHFVNIPLSLKKSMLVRKSIRPYIKIGPDINFILSSNVKPEQVRRESLNLEYYAPSKNYVDKAPVKSGILNGGNLSDNSYFGIHGAIGIEANLSETVQISVEVSQQFNPFQNGLGINDQKFTQTAASIGLKKRIYENYY